MLTPVFLIPGINFFISKMPITLYRHQFYPFMNLSEPLFNFTLMSNFKLTHLTKKNLTLYEMINLCR